MLLEREDERAALAAALDRSGACVLVSGPAGIGKTALLDETRERGPRVLTARGSELERSFAFGGVQQLFAGVTVPADGAAAHAAAAFSAGGEPDHAVLHGLYWLTAGLGPAAIVVDDAHWLDRPTLRWLVYMVNRVADLPLALILGARNDERDGLLSRIALHASTTVLEPKPLSPAAVATLAGPQRAEAIHDASGGVPFHVHALSACDDDPPRPVPESIALRLDALPPACLALARGIAVAGSGGTIAARLAGLDVRGAVEAAEALARAGILNGDGFAHPLVQDTVYAAIPAAQRGELHGFAAQLVTGPERIAAHVLAAGPGGGVKAARALRAAADVAWARGAPEIARTYLRRASEEELPRTELVPLLRELARARIATEGPGGLPAVLEALALASAHEREAIVLEIGRALTVQGYFAEAAEVFARGTGDEARTELVTVSVLDLALVRRAGGLDALASQLPADAPAAGAHPDAGGTPLPADAPAAGAHPDAGGTPRSADAPAAGAHRDTGETPRSADAPAAGAHPDTGGTPRPAGEIAVAAWIAVARRPPAAMGADRAKLALPHATPSSVASALVALMAAGRLEEADTAWTAVADGARADGELERLRLAVALRAIVRMRQGRVAEVEADLRVLLGWADELAMPFGDHRIALPWVISPLVDALLERGRLDEAQQWVAVTGLEGDWPEVFGFTFLLDSLARLRLAQRRAPEALNLARECGRRQRAWGIRNPGFLAWGSTLAAAAFATGRSEEALDAADEQIDLAAAFGVAREHGMALLAKGRITGDADTLRAAAETLAASPARVEHARALLSLGDRDSLSAALEIAERCGATVLASHARDGLAATGAQQRRAAPIRIAALTATQEQVARLSADGLSNREVAERLFVTERTIDGHLGAAYRKLGIASRSQLGLALDMGSAG